MLNIVHPSKRDYPALGKGRNVLDTQDKTPREYFVLKTRLVTRIRPQKLHMSSGKQN